ncbi:MAG: hypothetical protein IKO61_11225 [Lachnospiraceae bacterium]|nr:hypothetical protein [Lachnospiraceae bacterium]
MAKSTGVYKAKKKDGTEYYRCSVTVKGKHISLGSYDTEQEASEVYKAARSIIDSKGPEDISYEDYSAIPYQKFMILLNLKLTGVYFATPILLKKNYFEYHLSPDKILKFDRDDLFFYAQRKIQEKGGYLFVADYGSQYKILKRYGIKPFAVYGRDYVQVNDDRYDFRYDNIRVLSSYMGVWANHQEGSPDIISDYNAVIHVNGNYIIGTYKTETEAAVAYNKAVDILHAHGFRKAYIKNYIESLKADEYKALYDKTYISPKLYELRPVSVKKDSSHKTPVTSA